jgi:hypothetical protein
MLEFFRRSAPEQEGAPLPPQLEAMPRMLVLRRSQAVVVLAAAAAALVLAFLLGLALGGSKGDGAGPEVYVIRAADYPAGEQGQTHARKMKEQLEKLDLGEEVHVLESGDLTVVAVGSWLSNPVGRKDALALRDKLRAVKDANKATPFADAEFWPMKR